MPKILEQDKTILTRIFSTSKRAGYTTHINFITQKLNKIIGEN